MTTLPNDDDIIIIDPNLKDVLGHYFEYDAAVARGAVAIGRKPLVLANAGVEPAIAAEIGAVGTFRQDIWPPPGKRSRWSTLTANLSFLVDIRRALRRRHLAPNAVLFAHTFSTRQFLALALLPLLYFRRRSYTYLYLLRYQPQFYWGPVGRLSFRLLGFLAKYRTIRFVTDSDRLRFEFECLTACPFEVLPIPHVPPADSRPPSIEITCHFVSLGNARDEKGIFEILNAIRLLASSARQDGCRFTLQCNDAAPDVATAIAAFRDENLPGCELLFNKLDSRDYHDLLSQADIVLLPYWRRIYSSRTSGVFMEALSAGKPVIVTDDTWMSDQLRHHGAGLSCPDRDPAALTQAMLRACRDLASLRQRAAVQRDAWVETHNPVALATCLVSPPAAAPGRRRIAVFYPFSDLVEPRRGAARRTSLLIDFIKRGPVDVRVVNPSPASKLKSGNVLYEGHGSRFRIQRVIRLALRIPLICAYGLPGERMVWLCWEFLRPWIDLRLRRRLRSVVAWADVVVLEYPFWACVILPAAHRAGRKVVLTAHDILSEQLTGFPLLRRLVWYLERSALRSADAVLTVSPEDAALLAAQGIKSIVAPNPVDISAFAAAHKAGNDAARQVVAGLGLPFRQFALFVGSRHDPNIAAVAVLRTVAATLAARGDPAGIGIVVAGTCADPERNAAFVALGSVDEALLMDLYRSAQAAVIPLLSGTGSSVKTVEAMAAGLPVIGTAVAFRGLAVTDGETAIVENDTDQFANRLGSLLGDRDRCRRIGEAGRRFAEQFDYRRCFQPYLGLLGLPED